MNKRMSKFLAATLACVTVFSSMAVTTFADETTAAADAETTAAAAPEFDPSGEYKAYIGIQFDGSWVFRDTWGTPVSGGAAGYDCADGLSTVSAGVGTPKDGTFTDATLKGNGTYTVTLENPDITGATAFNLIQLATNIPAGGADTIKITDMTIKVDSMMEYTYDEAIWSEDEIKQGYLCALGQNKYNTVECVDCNAVFATFPATVGTVSITFTVSGFDYDNTDAAAETTAAETTAADAATTEAAAAEDSDDDDSSNTTTIVIVAVVAVVVVAVVAGVIVAGKKKKA